MIDFLNVSLNGAPHFPTLGRKTFAQFLITLLQQKSVFTEIYNDNGKTTDVHHDAFFTGKRILRFHVEI